MKKQVSIAGKRFVYSKSIHAIRMAENQVWSAQEITFILIEIN